MAVNGLVLVGFIGLSGVLAIKVVVDWFGRRDLMAKYQVALNGKITADSALNAVQSERERLRLLVDKAEAKIFELQRDSEDLLMRLRRSEQGDERIAGSRNAMRSSELPDYSQNRVYRNPEVSARSVQSPVSESPAPRGRPRKASAELSDAQAFRGRISEDELAIRQGFAESAVEVQPVVSQPVQPVRQELPELDAKTLIELRTSKLVCGSCQNSYFKPVGVVKQEGDLVTQQVKCGICGAELMLKVNL